MCCLFGILDYKGNLSLKKRQKILRVLSTECEERGTDATGIAYNVGSRLTIQKAPRPAHRMKFKLASDARFIMGHTRMATQGSEKQNYNNHPFSGRAGGLSFALAHNGVLYNERELRDCHHLSKPKVETDSYVAVQLLEKFDGVHFQSLAKMAEAVQGTFNFTVLDNQSNLYIVKGNNPMCIAHFPEQGFYLYASTQEILFRAVSFLRMDELYFEEIPIAQGDILCIAVDGTIDRCQFNDRHIRSAFRYSWGWDDCNFGFRFGHYDRCSQAGKNYLEELTCIAEYYGLDRETIQLLRDAGYSYNDIEEMLYDPELLAFCLDDALGFSPKRLGNQTLISG